MLVEFRKVNEDHYQIVNQSDDITRGSYEWWTDDKSYFVRSVHCPQFVPDEGLFLRGNGKSDDRLPFQVTPWRVSEFKTILQEWSQATGATVIIDSEIFGGDTINYCIGGIKKCGSGI